MNLSPANKNLFTISIHFILLNRGIPWKDYLNLNELVNFLFFTNLDFLLSHTVHLIKAFGFLFSSSQLLVFTFGIFSALQTIRQHCFMNRLKSLMNC